MIEVVEKPCFKPEDFSPAGKKPGSQPFTPKK
jgi:hypothetical protein